METIDDVADFLEPFEDTININLLEDNKYDTGNYVMLKNEFLNELYSKDFTIQGISSSEFYIDINSKEITIQISNFRLDSEIDF